MFTVTDADIVRATQAVFWIEGSQPDRFSRSIHHRPVLQATSQTYGHVLPVTNEQSSLTTAFHFPSCIYNNERVLSVGNEKALLTGVRVRPAPPRRRLTHIQLNAGSAHLMYYRQERTANPLLRIKSEASSFTCRTDVSDGQPGATRSCESCKVAITQLLIWMLRSPHMTPRRGVGRLSYRPSTFPSRFAIVNTTPVFSEAMLTSSSQTPLFVLYSSTSTR